MAERNYQPPQSNYNQMRAAGGAINLDPTSRKPSITDGKTRLFGLANIENEYGRQDSQGGSKGKRILHSGGAANASYNNIIGGNYTAEEAIKHH
jgi:hypothetical protein